MSGVRTPEPGPLVTITLWDHDGTSTEVGILPRSTFDAFSHFISVDHIRLFPGTDKHAVHVLLEWISSQVANLPGRVAPLSCPDIFEEAVHLHNVCLQMAIPGHLRGDVVRNGILSYVAMPGAAITLEEYAMLVELLHKDYWIQTVALRAIKERLNSGVPVPDWEKIQKYDEMMAAMRYV